MLSCDTLRDSKQLTLSSHDGEETSKVPDVLVASVPDDRTTDDGDDGVDADKQSTLPELVRGDGDAKGVDGGGGVGRCRETQRGDLRVTLTGENL